MRTKVALALALAVALAQGCSAFDNVPQLKELAQQLQELLAKCEANKSPAEWEVLSPMWLCAEAVLAENWQKAADADAWLRARLARKEWFERLGPNARMWGGDILREAAAEEKLDLHAVLARMINLAKAIPWDQRARLGVERFRKGQATVRVVDADGAPVAGAKVVVRQVSHDFLFGCAFPNFSAIKRRLGEEGWSKFQRYFTALFNYATSENMFKWIVMQPRDGPPSFADTDQWVAWCEANGVVPKGHCLVWGNKGGQGVPPFLFALAPQEVTRRVEQRIRSTVGRYAGRVRFWDVVNEPLHCHWFEQRMGPGYIAQCLSWARAADPQAKLIVNEFANFVGGAPRFRDLLRRLREQGAPIDAAGLQTHDNGYFYPPQVIFNTLDTVAQAGLPLHLTEITFSSDGRPIRGGYRQGRWTPEVQGQFYEYLYTMAFGHPAVEAITMWALWDGASWQPQGGIVGVNWQPKPAYQALDRLINTKWRTNLELTAGRGGAVTFRGFYGRYEIEVTAPDGRRSKTEVHLKKGAENSFVVRI